jgi:NAD(P)-dependent dehydrogenase (short-subunit alcohol dehydrogenase family)
LNPTRPLAIVTGARRGIGAAIAVELATQGFDLALTDIASDGADDALAAVQASGARVRLFVADLARIDEHRALVDEVAAWGGPIACLVNNAGIGSPQRGDLLELTPAAFDLVHGVNLRGTFFLTQAVARHMLATPTEAARSIVTVSSLSAEAASIERGEYCLSKSALAMLTRLYALRLAPHGVSVFEVRPGIIRTPMTAAVAARYDRVIADGLVPMGRWGEPQDVARAVAALASGRLGFATGSVVNVDGALSIPRL